MTGRVTDREAVQQAATEHDASRAQPPVDRRDVLGLASALGLSAAITTLAPGSNARAQTTAAQPESDPIGQSDVASNAEQVAGFYRRRVGAATVTVLSDGVIEWPSNLLASNVPDAQRAAVLKANYLPVETTPVHVNVCLIDTGDARILVGTGCGDLLSGGGRLLQNLGAAGVDPESITHIILTHGHPEQVGGLVDPYTESPRFPRAEPTIDEREWSRWTDPSAASALRGPYVDLLPAVQTQLNGVSALTRRIMIEEPTELVPGVSLTPAGGHTPGHFTVTLTSEGESVWLTGDVLQHAPISFEHPNWEPSFDDDPAVAVETRLALLDRAATEEALLQGAHLPWPGFGHVARKGRIYRWVPEMWRWDV